MKLAKTALIIIITLGLFVGAGSAFVLSHRTQAIQGCLELAMGTTTTTGTSDDNEWTVSEPQLNETVLQACLLKKGV